MKKLLLLSVLFLPACGPLERRGAVQDLGDYVHATAYPDGYLDRDTEGRPFFDGKPDYDPSEVAVKTAEEAAKRAGDPVALAVWAAAGGATLLIGWFKRRAIASAAVGFVKSTSKFVVGKPPQEDE